MEGHCQCPAQCSGESVWPATTLKRIQQQSLYKCKHLSALAKLGSLLLGLPSSSSTQVLKQLKRPLDHLPFHCNRYLLPLQGSSAQVSAPAGTKVDTRSTPQGSQTKVRSSPKPLLWNLLTPPAASTGLEILPRPCANPSWPACHTVH